MNPQGKGGTETQLTIGKQGFFINHMQCFSPDDQWIVYDSRTDDAQIIRNGSIGMVHVSNGTIKELYHTTNQTDYGPGVGAATFSPVHERVLFLHGIRNASKENPYGFTRRSGVAIDINKPFLPLYMDARDITFPFTKGALRGGTHAHSTSGDGKWISFTYNDYIIEQLSKNNKAINDIRTVGVMMPGKVEVAASNHFDNYSGEMFAAVIAEVTDTPLWGSDEIEKAFDETWIGTNGYVHSDGTRQVRAIAFQGNVRDKEGYLKTEVFIADLPDDISKARPGKPIEGTLETRPNVPDGVYQRRITFTTHGIQGPRHWLRSTSEGSLIAFLSKDLEGHIQIFGVSPQPNSKLRQITHHIFSVQSPFSFSPDDRHVAYVANNTIYITDMESLISKKVSIQFSDYDKLIGGVVWSNDSKKLAYNRYKANGKERYPHIFLLKDF